MAKHEDGSIYIDGGYAGQIGKLKKVQLLAGKHTIQLRDPRGHSIYSESVYVIAGKTVKIHKLIPRANAGQSSATAPVVVPTRTAALSEGTGCPPMADR